MDKTLETIVNKLNSIGIQTVPYAKNPLGLGGGFAIKADSRTRFRIWANEDANVRIQTDKKKRQAVLIVEEPKRVITRVVKTRTVYNGGRNYAPFYQQCEGITAEFTSTWRYNPISVPNARISRKILTTKEEHDNAVEYTKEYFLDSYYLLSKPRDTYFYFKVEVKYTCPKQTNSFLIGWDEDAMFICALPGVPTSVSNAREMLRPDNVPVGTTRQGEFFFIPATKEEFEGIVDSTPVSPRINYKGGYSWYPIENNSNHEAALLAQVNGEKFVCGVVRDRRRTRHHPIVLDGWYKVIRNKEIRMPNMQSSQTWD